MTRPMQCVILVGGLGTRLGSLTRDCPKPMLPVRGRPFVEYLIDNAARFGAEEIVLLAGHHGGVVAEHFESGRFRTPARTVSVKVLIEPEPLGTGGALRFAADHLAARFLMLNGDSMFGFNWLDLAAWDPGPRTVGRMALRWVEDNGRYGAIERTADGRVTAMRARPDVPGAGYINGGVYVLDRAVLDTIAPVGPVSLEADVFPALVDAQALVGRPYSGAFIDIGIPDDYAKAQQLPLDRRPAVFFDRDGVLNHDAGYTHRPDQWRWIEGAVDAIRACNDTDRYAFVVTNQAGVARGYYTEEHVRTLHHWIQADLARYGAHIDAFRYCPHHPDIDGSPYQAVCPWRKPNPGMITDLLAHWPVDRARSVLIGDTDSDLAAARAAGLPGIRYEGGSLQRLVQAHLDGLGSA